MKVYMKKATRQKWAWLLAVVMTVSIIVPASIMSAKAAVTNPSINASAGWFETAYAEWAPVTNATGYNVYVKAADAADSEYVQLDNELIRCYAGNNGNYYRADAVGLTAGSYVMKVVPLADGVEDSSKASVTAPLTVTSYDRTGFAWVDGDANGAYNADGSLKSNAVVLYITQDTKNTITMDVVKDNKGGVTSATGLQNILDLFKKGYDARPLAIRLIGQITDLATMEGGDIVISGNGDTKRISNGITFEGIGTDATADGWGLRIKNASNVEVRNIGFMNCDSDEGDNVGLQQNNDHVWVHNCDFFYGDAGSDSDQAKGDGALDSKLSTYVTFSYNHFWDSGKCNLLGLKEGTTEGYYITYHHNWYDHSDSRHPRCRYYSAHVYNNYYDGNAKYGVGSTLGSSVFVEGNYFRNCKYPMLTSLQGSDVLNTATGLKDYGNMGTFSGEVGGTIKAYNNTIIGAERFVAYGDSTVADSTTEFDAVVVADKNETISSDIKANLTTLSSAIKKGEVGSTYNNFDTSSVMYAYTAQSPEDAKTTVEAYAGRMDGGDFVWEFDDAVDDTSYAVNTALKSALTSYATKLISVGGGSTVSGGTTQGTTQATTGSTQNPSQEATTGSVVTPTTGSQVQNFTTDGMSSSFYTISGNLSDSKGTVTYNGLTLTQCLKMESATSIKFNATSKGTLTLVFNSDFAKKVKVDGEKYTVTAGLLTMDLAAGSHEITKGDSANLFYMIFTPEGSETPSTEATTSAPTQAATEASTGATEETTTGSVTPDVTPENGYNKTSVEYSGAYTTLSTLKDADYLKKVYVAPYGTSGGAGTTESPLDLETAINNATAGTAIIMQGGTYVYDHQVTIAYGNNGSAENYKVLKAADDADVILDFSSQPYGDTSTNARGLQVEGDYWYINGITCYGAADNGMFLAGKSNIVERCILQANRDTGLQVSRRNSSLSDMADWPSDNYIINCTSFDNCDPATGENADGFAAKLTCGEGNVFDGCIAYCNCDDGWDLYAKVATGSIGVVTIRNCIAFNNGTLTDGSSEANGDMNGFKLGGSNGKVPTPHYVFNCLAFNNGKDGFTDNGNGGSLSVINCTSVGNTKSNFNFYRTTAGGTFLNLLSASTTQTDKFIGKISNSIYANSKKFYSVPFSIAGTSVTNGEKVGTITTDPMTSGAFISTSVPSVIADIDSIFRNQNGTLNVNGVYMSTGTYAGMGAKYNVANQVLAVKANTTGNAQEEPTQAPTQATEATQATQETTEATQAPTQTPTQPTETPTEETQTGVSAVLNASNMTESIYTSSFIFDGFGILAKDDTTVTVDASKKNSYTKRLKLGGAGSTLTRAIVLKTAGSSTITADVMSSNGSTTRMFQILDASGNVLDSKEIDGKSINVVTFTVDNAGTYYLASAASGVNVYKVTVTNSVAVTAADLVQEELPTEATTEATTQATTEATTQATTVAPTEATTVAPTEATTVAPTEATTVASTEATTVASTEATTVASTEATTVAPTQAPTEATTAEVAGDEEQITTTAEVAADEDQITNTTEETKRAEVAADEGNVQTGDASHVMVYAILVMVALSALGAGVVWSKKRRV